MYVRILKYKFGWKKATFKIFNQKYILDQMNTVVMIATRENLPTKSMNSLIEKRSPDLN